MIKKDLRKIYKSKRAALTFQERLKLDDLLLIQFQKISLPFLQNFMSFYPLEEKGEMDTFIITDYLKFTNPGIQITYPKTSLADCSMKAIAVLDEADFEENEWGIPEPAGGEEVAPQDLDAVLVPLLAFDEKGNRVGYGKGFYDRFLQQCRADCITIGLCYFDPVPLIEDAGNYDVTLNYCLTPQRVYVF